MSELTRVDLIPLYNVLSVPGPMGIITSILSAHIVTTGQARATTRSFSHRLGAGTTRKVSVAADWSEMRRTSSEVVSKFGTVTAVRSSTISCATVFGARME